MSSIVYPGHVRILFDETHSQSWSVCRERAAEVSPDYPEYSSYAHAAQTLASRDFALLRHVGTPLTPELLAGCDILALLHPCDSRWERTVGGHPALSDSELGAVQDFVTKGGSLLVVTEYEHDKYGDNLNELLLTFGLWIENATVLDRAHCEGGNPAWIYGRPCDSIVAQSLTTGVAQACFYQAGHCRVLNDQAELIMKASESASVPGAGLIAVARHGQGRVVVVTDSLLFGDEHLSAPGHRALWLNLAYWLAVPAFARMETATQVDSASRTTAWDSLKQVVDRLRGMQATDGSVALEEHAKAGGCVVQMRRAVAALRPSFPHQEDYFTALDQDLAAWQASGYGRPDFARSLAAYRPHEQRSDGREHLVLFPLYTPNASSATRFEALILRMPWPVWLEVLERGRYLNPKFAPGHLVDCTEGYRSECAVLFPETVSILGKSSNRFATILCDREARRLQHYARHSIEALQLAVPPEASCLLESLARLEDTVALWDLIHDRAHGLGELPFDPFMIRQRAPFWMYGLEELRVDLRSFCEALQLAEEGFALAQQVPYAILFDRLFRFPISGSRIRNYDGLAGQLLFAFLHDKDVAIWCDNRLTLDWPQVPAAVEALRREIALLYRHGAACSKLSFWLEAHDLISRYVKPSVASRWKKEGRVIDSEEDVGRWLAAVQDDEFPLGGFHLNLKRRLATCQLSPHLTCLGTPLTK